MTKLKQYKMFINGEWVDSESKKTFETLNPENNEPWAIVPEASAKDVDKAVNAAQKAFEGEWSQMPASEREKLIWRLADAMEENLEELAQMESLNVGKPIGMAQFIDIPLSVKTMRYFAGFATKINGDLLQYDCPYTPGVNYHAYTKKEAIGVCGMIIPLDMPSWLLYNY